MGRENLLFSRLSGNSVWWVQDCTTLQLLLLSLSFSGALHIHWRENPFSHSITPYKLLSMQVEASRTWNMECKTPPSFNTPQIRSDALGVSGAIHAVSIHICCILRWQECVHANCLFCRDHTAVYSQTRIFITIWFGFSSQIMWRTFSLIFELNLMLWSLDKHQ